MKRLILLFTLISLVVVNTSCEKTIEDEPIVKSLQEQYSEWSNFISNSTLDMYDRPISAPNHYRLSITINGDKVKITTVLPNQYDVVDGEDIIVYDAEGITINGTTITFTKCSFNGIRLNHNFVYEYTKKTNGEKSLKDNTDGSHTYNYTYIQKPI